MTNETRNAHSLQKFNFEWFTCPIWLMAIAAENFDELRKNLNYIQMRGSSSVVSSECWMTFWSIVSLDSRRCTFNQSTRSNEHFHRNGEYVEAMQFDLNYASNECKFLFSIRWVCEHFSICGRFLAESKQEKKCDSSFDFSDSIESETRSHRGMPNGDWKI